METCLLAIQCIKNNKTSKCQRLLVTCQIGGIQWNCDFNENDRDSVYLVYFMLDCLRHDIRAAIKAIKKYDITLFKKLQDHIKTKIISLQSIDTTNSSNASANISQNSCRTFFSHNHSFQIKPFAARPLSLFVKLICERLLDVFNKDIFELHSFDDWSTHLNFLCIAHLLLQVSTEILFFEPKINYSDEVKDLPSSLYTASRTLERHILETLRYLCEIRDCTYRPCVLARLAASVFNFDL